MTNVLSSKIMVLGVDGMDPRLAKKYVDEGKMPNLKTIIERGAQREDLVLLGIMPTITPPGWTSLATGAYPGTHGITCFWNQDPEHLDTIMYSLDSTLCQAEQLWNVTAEAGYRTMVWHWPGSSWPPTSTNPHLHVVDGTQPGFVNFGVGMVDEEKLVVADQTITDVIYMKGGIVDTGAGCIIHDLEVTPAEESAVIRSVKSGGKTVTNVMLELEDGELAGEYVPLDLVNSPIDEPKGWTVEIPAGAKEFTIITSMGLTKRPALILANADGVYDTVKLYKSKKETEPLVTLQKGVMSEVFMDVAVKEDGSSYNVARLARVLDLAEDGSHLRMWLSGGVDNENDWVWHPHDLLKEVVDNVGHFTAASNTSGTDARLSREMTLDSWEVYCQWQADVFNYFIKEDKYDVIFSHLHNVDAMGHKFWQYGVYRDHLQNDPADYLQLYEDVYKQTDRYFGKLIHALDEGWTIIITSDHGLICAEEERQPLLGDPFGVNVRIMQELGFTALKKDADGNDLKEIDWEHTKAIAARTCHIYINLKGRNATGIVEPEDKYDVERQIIDALYNYRDPKTGKRIITLALRQQDAVLLGLEGPGVGDIVYWLEEGFHRVHGDALTTQKGLVDTSVAAIFAAAGPGIKQGATTNRHLKQVDVAPTIATLLGTRMPAQCEGAPMYQIIDYDAAK